MAGKWWNTSACTISCARVCASTCTVGLRDTCMWLLNLNPSPSLSRHEGRSGQGSLSTLQLQILSSNRCNAAAFPVPLHVCRPPQEASPTPPSTPPWHPPAGCWCTARPRSSWAAPPSQPGRPAPTAAAAAPRGWRARQSRRSSRRAPAPPAPPQTPGAQRPDPAATAAAARPAAGGRWPWTAQPGVRAAAGPPRGRPASRRPPACAPRPAQPPTPRPGAPALWPSRGARAPCAAAPAPASARAPG